MLYTYGGTPSEVLTTATGDAVPDYPVTVRVAGTGQSVTALYEADGTTPISQLRSNGATSAAPGMIRQWMCEWPQIEYEYNASGGRTVRWYAQGRELAPEALQTSQTATAGLADRLSKSAGGTVTGPVTLSGGAVFTGAAAFTGPVTGIPTIAGLRWRNVTDYGAVGNGATDDVVAIQAALDAAYTAGGGVVVFPPGRTYCVTTFMVVRANTTVIAYGATIKSIYATRGVLRNFYGEDSFAAYSGHSNIQVMGGTWDGNAYKAADGSGIVTGTTNIMTFIHCSNIIVRDAIFRDTSGAHGLEINAVSGCRVENCRFEGFVDNSGDGSRATSEFVEIDLAKAGNSAIGALDNTACKDVTFERCWFGPSARFLAAGRAIGSHGIATGAYYDRITVRDCEIYGTTADCGIRAYYWRDSHISGNTISGTVGAGILAVTDTSAPQTCRALTITDNIVSGAQSDAGIRVSAVTGSRWSDIQIRGNTISNATGYGIRADYAPAVSIIDNRVNSTVSGGILAQDCDGPTVNNNSVSQSGSNGINVAGCTNGIVSGNLVDTTATNHGIVAGSATLTAKNIAITGNLVRAASSSGIRIGVPGCTVTANTVRKDGGTTVNGIGMSAGATGAVIAGNDLTNSGWSPTTGVSVVGTAVLDWAGGTAAPGHNRT